MKLGKIQKMKLSSALPLNPNFKVLDSSGLSEGDAEEVFVCECSSLDHVARFLFLVPYDGPGKPKREPTYEENVIYVDLVLETWEGFWRRLWNSIRLISGYTFNADEDYGLFQSLLFRKDDLARLQNILGHVSQNLDPNSKTCLKAPHVDIVDNPYLLRFGISFDCIDEERNEWIVEFYVHVNVDPVASFWQRLKIAYNYFVHKSTRRGHQWEFELKKEHIESLRSLVSRMQQLYGLEPKDATNNSI
jgi:hypothetical protein